MKTEGAGKLRLHQAGAQLLHACLRFQLAQICQHFRIGQLAFQICDPVPHPKCIIHSGPFFQKTKLLVPE